MSDKLELWRKRKKELGLKNKDIAEIADLPLRTVEQVMCGTVQYPRLDTVQAIERALGLDSSPSVSVPERYSEVYVALREGDDDLGQDDIDDIVRFIEFKKSTKKK